jgi:RHS repeat-associated protein
MTSNADCITESIVTSGIFNMDVKTTSIFLSTEGSSNISEGETVSFVTNGQGLDEQTNYEWYSIEGTLLASGTGTDGSSYSMENVQIGSYNIYVEASNLGCNTPELNTITSNTVTANVRPPAIDYNQSILPFSTSNTFGTIPGTADVSPTGAATYTIPISLPPGTAGMMPNLSVVYSSQSAGGMLGHGWTIGGFSAITRVGTNLHDDGYIDGVDFDEYDQFALDGNRLVSVGASEYRTQQETFSKITSSGSIAGDPASFVVESKDGSKLYYGSSSASRFLASDLTDQPVLAWLLDKVEDANGNYYTIDYEILANEYFPKEIQYTYNDAAGLTAYNAVKFHFGTKKINDQSFGYIGGSKIESTVILNEIEVHHEGSLVSKYNFKYKNELLLRNNFQPYLMNNCTSYGTRSFLSEIILSEADGEGFNSTKIEWSENMPTQEVKGNLTNLQADGSFYPGDYNGDGKTDMLVTVYSRNIDGIPLHEGSWLFLPPVQTEYKLYTVDNDGENFTLEQTYPIENSFTSFYPGDFNGDGKTDLLKRDATGLYLQFSEGTYFDPEIEVVNDKEAHQFGFYQSQYIDVGDFNGDGRGDWVLMTYEDESHYTVSIYTYDPSQAENCRKIHLNNVTTTYGTDFEIKHYVGDFNGNGKTDLLLVNYKQGGTTSELYEFGGNPVPIYDAGGNIFGKMPNINLQRIGSYSYPTKDHIIYPGDFNGDGKTDMLTYHETDGWELKYSGGDSFIDGESFSWEPPDIVEQPPGIIVGTHVPGPSYNYSITTQPYDKYNYSIGDFDGDGSDEILKQRLTESSASLFITDLNRKKTASSYEATFISISSACLTHSFQAGTRIDFDGDGKHDFFAGSGDYTQNRVIYNLFPDKKDVQIKIITNGLNQETKFDYSLMTKNDVDIYDEASEEGDDDVIEIKAPISLVYKMYNQNGSENGFNSHTLKYTGLKFHKKGKGLLGFEKVTSTDDFGKVTESVYDFDPTYYNVRLVTNKIGYNDNNYQQVTYQNRTVARNNDKSIINYIDSKTDYDKINDITITTTYQQYDNYGNLEIQTVDYDGEGTTTTTNTYEQTKGWCPSSINTSEVVKVRGTEDAYTRTIDNDYDTDGNLITVKADESDALKKLVTNLKDYNAFGFPETVEVQGRGNTEIITKTTKKIFDPKGRFVVEETVIDPDSDDFVSSSIYDYKFGNVTSTTDAQGKTTTYQYDDFGRLTKTILPNLHEINQEVDWVAENENLNPPENAWYYTETTQEGTGYSRIYYDVLGRKLREETQGFDGTPIFKDFVYNEKGQIIETTDPYFMGDKDAKNTSTTYYDDYDRIDNIETPYGNVSYDYSVSKQVKITQPGNEWKNKRITAFGDADWVEDDGGKIDYEYYSSGLLKSTTTDGSGTIDFVYDIHGNRTKMTDPNAGEVNNTYDAFGNPLTHNDEKGDYTMIYDDLGRIENRTRTGTDEITSYIYEKSKSSNGFGKLKQVTYGTYIQDYEYDEYDRLKSAKETIDGTTFEYRYTYDEINRVETTTYPKGKNGSSDFILTSVYNDYGYLHQIMRNSQTEPVWQADEMNAVGQFKQITKGNSLVTNFKYDGYHRPSEIKTTGILEYEYDFEKETGNLLSRTDVTGDRKFTERFEYDEGFDRIEYGFSKVGSNQEVQRLHMQYYNNGNIDKKSDVGTYNYDPDQLHAVTSITDLAADVAIPSAGQIINYTAFKKILDIEEDGKTLVFTYGPGYQRRKTIFDDGSGTTKTKYFMGNYEEEIDNNGNYRKLYYIPGGESLAGVYVVENSEANMYYTYTDYLGSILAITKNNEISIHQKQRFDPWGRRRNLDDWLYDNVSSINIIDRGYTNHQHLNEFGIINMNGRLYDPVVGRMLSPDPYVQMSDFTQNFNRYSYVINNPLSYVDPDGNFFLTPMLVAAVQGGIINTTVMAMSGKINNFNDGIKAFGIGFVSGALSNAVPQLLTETNLFYFTTKSQGGLMPGFFPAAVSAGIGGFSASFGNQIFFNGASPKEAANKSIIPAAVAGLSAGIASGINSSAHGRDFWTGQGTFSRNKFGCGLPLPEPEYGWKRTKIPVEGTGRRTIPDYTKENISGATEIEFHRDNIVIAYRANEMPGVTVNVTINGNPYYGWTTNDGMRNIPKEYYGSLGGQSLRVSGDIKIQIIPNSSSIKYSRIVYQVYSKPNVLRIPYWYGITRWNSH